MIAPGETIGILGGGQLGRMIALAAAQLGYRCHVFAPEPDAIAAEVCARFTNADWHDREAMAAFAADCAVITYEFENVPVVPVAALAPVPVLPHPRALETAQDRLAEKVFVSSLGGTPAPFAEVDSDADLRAALARIGTPGILKTRRDGYDGKGQWRIASPEDADRLDLPTVPLIYEGFVQFDAEFSVILCRGADGDIRFWDSAQNVHVGGILATSTLPAGPQVLDQIAAARELVLLSATANLPGNFETRAAHLGNAAALNAAGVTIAIKGVGVHRAREARYNAGNAVAHGLPHAAALAALTVNPARIFGDEGRYGVLAPGAEADVVVWSGDPLELSTQAEAVFIRGVPQGLESRQTKLARRYLPGRDRAELPEAYRR